MTVLQGPVDKLHTKNHVFDSGIHEIALNKAEAGYLTNPEVEVGCNVILI